MQDGSFSHVIGVRRSGDGRYAARLDRRWWVARGPNGGYIAAVLLRALEAEVADRVRSPRSLTIHYLRPPEEGDAEVLVSVERAGRSVTTLQARLVQAGRTMAIAVAAFGGARDAAVFDDAAVPEVPEPDSLSDLVPPAHIQIHQRYRKRWAIGSPFREGVPSPDSEGGGWIRPVEPTPVDHALVAALTDAWFPSVFSRFGRVNPVPTLDLTIHFREPPPGIEDWCLVRFRSRKAFAGYVEEDGEVWSRDGRLLAQSRQLAVMLSV